MVVSERDRICAKSLLEILHKVKIELQGSEILVAGRVFEWSADLLKRIENDLKPQPPAPQVTEPKVTITEESKLPKSKTEILTNGGRKLNKKAK